MRQFFQALTLGLGRVRRGQSMTEYALILAAVAVVVFATYHVMGEDIVHLLGRVNHELAQ